MVVFRSLILLSRLAPRLLVYPGMDRPRERVFWKRSTFWITVAAIVLPFGWLLFALKLEPAWVRARYFRRGF